MDRDFTLLGRKEAPDERDHNFPLRQLLQDQPPERHYRYAYANAWWGDQGRTPQCVAYAWMHWLEDGPITQPLTAHKSPSAVMLPRRFYDECQQLDEYPGSNYDGTSVRAGAKVSQQHGFIENYHWAFEGATAVKALLEGIPLVMGTWWRSRMWEPDANGFVRYAGTYDGGHAWVANGCWIPRGMSISQAIRTNSGYIRGKNSWGRGWGKRGHFYMDLAHFDQSIREHGEACVATEIRKTL